MVAGKQREKSPKRPKENGPLPKMKTSQRSMCERERLFGSASVRSAMESALRLSGSRRCRPDNAAAEAIVRAKSDADQLMISRKSGAWPLLRRRRRRHFLLFRPAAGQRPTKATDGLKRPTD